MGKHSNRKQNENRTGKNAERHELHEMNVEPIIAACMALDEAEDGGTVTIPLHEYTRLVTDRAELNCLKRIIEVDRYSSDSMRAYLGIKKQLS